MSGMEIMLKSMGLGHVIEMAQQLANEGTLDKILRFADGLEELNGRLARIENMLTELVGYDGDGNLQQRTADAIRTGEALIAYSSSERLGANGSAPDNGAGGTGQSGAD